MCFCFRWLGNAERASRLRHDGHRFRSQECVEDLSLLVRLFDGQYHNIRSARFGSDGLIDAGLSSGSVA